MDYKDGISAMSSYGFYSMLEHWNLAQKLTNLWFEEKVCKESNKCQIEVLL